MNDPVKSFRQGFPPSKSSILFKCRVRVREKPEEAREVMLDARDSEEATQKLWDQGYVVISVHQHERRKEDPEKFLMQLGSLVGMSEADFESCTQNKEFEKSIIEKLQAAQAQYKLDSVPAFIFNDGKKIVTGYKTAEQFKKIVEELTAK